MGFIENIKTICSKYSAVGYYFMDDIPEKKIKNASMTFPIPIDEQVIALIDATVFGSCKSGLAVCLGGIYWRNDWTKGTLKKRYTWEEFAKVELSEEDNSIKFEKGVYFDTSGASMKREFILNLLWELSREAEKAEGNITPPALDMWYVLVDDEELGPYDIITIREMIEDEVIHPDVCYVWKEGMDEWTEMKNVQELYLNL